MEINLIYTMKGLIKLECKFVKTDPEVIESVANKTGKDPQKIQRAMRYNVFTVKTFATLTGLSVSTILNKTSESVINGNIDTELDFCYPFGLEEDEGPKFIVRNEKAEKYFKL